jgi:uncharacterized membrane protein
MATAEQAHVDAAGERGEEAAGEDILAAGEISPRRRRSRNILSVAFIAAGINHFISPKFYEAMVPPPLDRQAGPVVAISGVAEIAGGLGVLLPFTRRLSGAGLVALLIAVFPANIYMAMEPERFKKVPRWGLLARLPLQPLMMWWAWSATRR